MNQWFLIDSMCCLCDEHLEQLKRALEDFPLTIHVYDKTEDACRLCHPGDYK